MSAANISFDNTAVAFSSKKNGELIRIFWLFKLMNSPLLVGFSQKLASWAVQSGLPVKGFIKATVFDQFCGGESIEGCEEAIDNLSKYNIKTILDYSVEGNETEADFDESLKEKLTLVRYAKDHPNLPFCVIKLTGIARFALLEKISSKQELDPVEQREYEKVKERFDQLCKLSFTYEVPLLIDAEESWIQDAIDSLAMEMMKTYNKNKPVIYNTLQMYRSDRLKYLKSVFDYSRNENFFLGLKIVRGAYMEQERARARHNGYQSPIHENKAATDKDYDAAISFCLQNIDYIGLCAATHNEHSALELIKTMESTGISKEHPHMFFGQLYGMSDQITYNLAYSGYNVAKYMPYGPVKKVLPYLIRRAQENASISGQMGRELSLIVKERKRRKG